MTTITVIGGGSSMFVPGLVRRLLELEPFRTANLRLMDVDGERLGVMTRLASELSVAEQRGLKVTGFTDQREALRNADFVIVAVSVGGMTAWESDIEIPAKHGVFMHIADSIGPGGIFRALRNTPVVTKVIRDVAEVAPDAYVLNYTNPASVNTIAMAAEGERCGVRTFSLCSCSPLPYLDWWLADMVGVPADEIVRPSQVGGINHCTGITELRLRNGTDAIPLVRDRTGDDVVRWAIDTFGVVPYCWTHWCEFFPSLQRLEEGYAGRAQGLAMRYGRRIYDTDSQRVRMATWEGVAHEWQRSPGTHRLSDLPAGPEDEGIIVAELMAAVLTDDPQRFIVNTTNGNGLIPNLPAGCAVEVPAMVTAAGVRPLPIDPLPDGLAGVLGRHAHVQMLTAQAATTGDRQALDAAMATDPLLEATLEPAQIRSLTKEMLAVNAPLLGAELSEQLLGSHRNVTS